MEYKETRLKSALYPFVLRVVGSEEDIECFKSLIGDSSDMSGYCISFSKNYDVDAVDPTNYKLSGMTIFEWRKENRALAAKVRELENSYEHLVDDNHALARNLAAVLVAKPPYMELHRRIADLEGYIHVIAETVTEAIERCGDNETD